MQKARPRLSLNVVGQAGLTLMLRSCYFVDMGI